jgi:myosin heavy subunit
MCDYKSFLFGYLYNSQPSTAKITEITDGKFYEIYCAALIIVGLRDKF